MVEIARGFLLTNGSQAAIDDGAASKPTAVSSSLGLISRTSIASEVRYGLVFG